MSSEDQKPEEKLEERLAVRVTKSEKQAFANKAKLEGKTTSQLLLHLVRKYIAEQSSGADEQMKVIEEKVTANVLSKVEELIKQQMGESPGSGAKTAA